MCLHAASPRLFSCRPLAYKPNAVDRVCVDTTTRLHGSFRISVSRSWAHDRCRLLLAFALACAAHHVYFLSGKIRGCACRLSKIVDTRSWSRGFHLMEFCIERAKDCQSRAHAAPYFL